MTTSKQELSIDPFTLPSVLLLERKDLPKSSGIYFLLHKERKEIIYVGKAKNFYLRWQNHQRWYQFKDRPDAAKIVIAWWECKQLESLLYLENLLIRHFKPSLNLTAGRKPKSISEGRNDELLDTRRKKELLELLQINKLIDSKQEFSNDSQEVQVFATKAQELRQRLKVDLGITISDETLPLRILSRVLKKAGAKLREVRRVGKRGNQKSCYVIELIGEQAKGEQKGRR
jgi:hypothetical protein